MKNLNKTILTLMMLLIGLTANADGYGPNNDSDSNSNAQQGQYIDSHDNIQASDLSKMVPSVSAPSLTTTLTETCMGSTSFGGAGAGFGFSFGTTWRDSACVRRLDSRQLAAFNDMPTAREIMCASVMVREAAKRAGRPCVEDGGIVAYNVQQTMQNPSVVQVPPVVTDSEPTEEEVAAIMVLQPDQNKTTNAVNSLDPAIGPIYRVETPAVD